MSLLGSMTTAISGLAAQARALGHVSDNVANSQTVGFKPISASARTPPMPSTISGSSRVAIRSIERARAPPRHGASSRR
jgi:flagellar hook protein FlgE